MMDFQTMLPERRIAIILLISSFIVFAIGGFLFTGRTIWKWPAAQSTGYLIWERSIVVLAVLVSVWALVLLEDLLRASGETIISQLALATYLIGAVVVVVAEMSYLQTREWAYTQVVVFVVLAFLAQAAFGLALLQTDLVAPWAGWATIIWNLGWPVVLAVVSPKDMYFPALHHVAPLIIGIALLTRR